MIEIDIVKLNKEGICVDIKTMTVDQWKTLKKQKGFVYRPFQKGFNQCTIGV